MFGKKEKKQESLGEFWDEWQVESEAERQRNKEMIQKRIDEAKIRNKELVEGDNTREGKEI